MKGIVTLLVILWIVIPYKSFGCSCARTETISIDSSFYDADVVFKGRVVRVVADLHFLHQIPNLDSDFLTFEVLKNFKNTKENNIPLTFINQKTSCDFNFQEGDEYFVFGYQGDCGVYFTNVCTDTDLVKNFPVIYLERLEELSFNSDINLERTKLIDPASAAMMDLTIEQLKASNETLQNKNKIQNYLLWGFGFLVMLLASLLIKIKSAANKIK